MAKMRAWLLIALVIGVAITWTTSAATGRLFSTYAYFLDHASDTGNTITATSLAAPTGFQVFNSATDPEGSLDLEWTRSTSLFATEYEIFRRLNPGSYPSSAEATAVCNTMFCDYTDSGLDDNTEYCYKVRTKFQQWTSDFTDEKCATTESADVPDTILLLHSNLTMSTTSATPGTVSIAPTGANSIARWSYTPAVGTTIDDTTFTVNLVLGPRPNPSASIGANATIRVYVATNCTSAGTTLAQATGVSIPKVEATLQGFTVNLNPTTSHTFTSGQLLCLSIQNTTGTPGVAFTIDVVTDTTSTSGVSGVQSSLLVPLAPAP